jgi:signal transduction histidine kinase
MTALLTRRGVSVSVAWRLIAGLLPTVLAVGLVVGLFYYGELNREAPRIVLLLASVLTVISVGVTLANARYFINRIGRLARVTAGADAGDPRADEFDKIEAVVGTLGTALSAAEAERARAGAIAEAHRREEATMLAGLVSDSLSQLNEVRMPLHILLEAPFGELNENQEELLRDARSATDAIDTALRRLGQVAEVDRGTLPVQRELVQVNDVVRSILPLARAAAERRGARIDSALEPGLPRVLADRPRLAEALALLVAESANEANNERPLAISTARDGARAVIRIVPAATAKDRTGASTSIFAERLITAQGGELARREGGLDVRIGG